MGYIMILRKGVHFHALVFSLILLNASITNCVYVGGRKLPLKIICCLFFLEANSICCISSINHNGVGPCN
jgi:hypothetical protein